MHVGIGAPGHQAWRGLGQEAGLPPLRRSQALDCGVRRWGGEGVQGEGSRDPRRRNTNADC